MYTEFTKNNIFEQLTLAVACSASTASGEVSISECNITLRRVKVERYSLPVTTIQTISDVNFSAFSFQYCFLYEAPFSTSRSTLVFANDTTTNYLFIYMELSFRSGPP